MSHSVERVAEHQATPNGAALVRLASTSVPWRCSRELAARPLGRLIGVPARIRVLPHRPRVGAGAAEELPLGLVALDDVLDADEPRLLTTATLGSIGHR